MKIKIPGWLRRIFGKTRDAAIGAAVEEAAGGLAKVPDFLPQDTLIPPNNTKSCQNCGAENRLDANFCGRCGAKLT